MCFCGCVGSAQAAVPVPGPGGQAAGESGPGQEGGAGGRRRPGRRRRGHPQRAALTHGGSQRPRALAEKELCD